MTKTEKIIYKNFNSDFVSLVTNLITRGYILTNRILEMDEYNILNNPLGKEFLPYLRRSLIGCLFEKEINSGNLGLWAKTRFNSNRSSRHIELCNDRFVLTVSHVNYTSQLPRKADFRNNLIFESQLELDLDTCKVIVPQFNKNGSIYIMVTHGGEERPHFINLGIPDGGGTHWLAKRDILNENISVIIEDDSLDEMLDEQLLVGLKQHIKINND